MTITSMILSSEMVCGARFEMRINDRANPGSLVWAACEVTSADHTVSAEGTELWPAKRDDGARTWVNPVELRRIGG